MNKINRKTFLEELSLLTGASLLAGPTSAALRKKSKMKLGMVTYLWGKDWDVPTLIQNCTTAGIAGAELRVEHAHKVMPDLSAAERQEVKKRFADSPVKLVGLGTNEQYDYPDPERLRKSIERTKEFIRLSADVGGSGVKVKPNQLHKDVPVEKTLEQIGRSLDELAKYAADFGQQLRLEVHGNETQELPNIKTIMDHAPNKNATVCWNSNKQDLNGNGLEYNFNLVKNRLGDTCHVREFNDPTYPYQQFLDLLAKANYKGWVLLECHTNPADKIASLIAQRQLFEKMTA
ncbi:sugar phosphate isomerase/epimerase family protein [Larkinella terrae]|uniref:TIM barrel protein n=1 Tax=Larkinella terrae TaxID=2025311 RepID=A0A7K0EGF9_9BACT|nr:TIM barrel protein [Larkinella terrae]MRS60536.1 TIM barrel protein [Larkinella terrae]